MNKRNFLKTLVGLPLITLIGNKAEAKTMEPKYDRMKLSHFYSGSYHCPNDLWTPEEIVEAGFVFVPTPSFIHRWSNPLNPDINHHYVWSNDPDKDDKHPMICKTRRFCGAGYVKTYDLDKGRWRGIESVCDYFRKKDIFKPQIFAWMKEMEYHYVHRVLLEDSPVSWRGKFGDSDMIFHRYAVNVRGCRLPKRI